MNMVAGSYTMDGHKLWPSSYAHLTDEHSAMVCSVALRKWKCGIIDKKMAAPSLFHINWIGHFHFLKATEQTIALCRIPLCSEI